MNIKNITLLILCSTILFLFSCERENIDKVVYEEPNYDPSENYLYSPIQAVSNVNEEGVELGCVKILFPFTILLEEEQTLLINNRTEFSSNQNSSEVKILDFVYPIDGINHLGENSSFENALKLARSYASCVPESGWSESNFNGTTIPAFLMEEYCIELSYPIDLIDVEGNVLVANNEIEFIQYQLTKNDLQFILPINGFHDDTPIKLESLEEVFNSFTLCERSNYNPVFRGNNGVSAHPFDCFSFVYPVDVLIIEPDTILTLNNEDELVQLSMSGDEFEFIYPFEIIDEMGNVNDIQNELDFLDVLVDCGLITIDTTATNPCNVDAHILLFFNGLNIFTLNNYEYEMVYPITLIVEGNPVVLNTDDDYIPAIGSPSDIKSTEIVYPVSIIQFGRTLTFNNDQDVCDFYSTLDEDCSNKPAHIELFHNTVGVPLTCGFFVEFPMSLSRNGSQLIIQDRDEYISELNTPGAYDELQIVYPVSAYKVNNGQQIIFNSDSEICDYLNNCF